MPSSRSRLLQTVMRAHFGAGVDQHQLAAVEFTRRRSEMQHGAVGITGDNRAVRRAVSTVAEERRLDLDPQPAFADPGRISGRTAAKPAAVAAAAARIRPISTSSF